MHTIRQIMPPWVIFGFQIWKMDSVVKNYTTIKKWCWQLMAISRSKRVSTIKTISNLLYVAGKLSWMEILLKNKSILFQNFCVFFIGSGTSGTPSYILDWSKANDLHYNSRNNCCLKVYDRIHEIGEFFINCIHSMWFIIYYPKP